VGEHEIAVVGMSGRFPGARSVAELWRNLRDGVESLTFWSDEELLDAGVDAELLEDPSYVKACFYLPGQDQFDAGFFEMNPREAELTDPQQRIFLECAWEALEDAGVDPTRYGGSIGVFAGSGRNNYVLNNLLTNPQVLESMGVVAVSLGNEKDFLATRVSYKLDLRGPSVTVQNACSSSLVGVHLGAQALLGGECDLVLAGGVCVAALKKEGYPYVEGGIFAPDGHLRAFDKRAGGQVGGNGAAIVVLKRLEDAQRDGDTIRAVLVGSAVNNDGVQKVSFSAPGVEGQSRVVAEALEVSGVDPESIGYVETHGTGTHLGDPIEVTALSRAWRQWTDKTAICPIGSLKTNIGHLDAGAGVAGLIKTSLSLQHGLIPPSLNYDEPNPEIDFAASPFFVNTELRPWPRSDVPRRAGVSSFGMGGTNVHAIIEEAPEPAPTVASRRRQLLLVSARSEAARDVATANLAKHLEQERGLILADAAFTTQVGRRAFKSRRAVVCSDRVDAANALRKLERATAVTGAAAAKPRTVGFLFTGQGAQYPGMARGLYEAEPTFRAALDECCEVLIELTGRDLRELILGKVDGAAKELERTQYTQPALFAVEWALARLWGEWGIVPDAMLGHSIGEYTAACLAGVFSLADALKLVAARGKLIGDLPAGGTMLAVHMEEAELVAQLPRDVSLAAVNAPGVCVAAGPEVAVVAFEAALAAQDVSTGRLHTSHAFHSVLMDPVLDEFRSVVAKVELRAPTRPLVSCTTGTWLSDAEATDPDYWVRHLRQGVRFADGVRTLAADGRCLLEVGPGETLGSLARLTAPEASIVSSTRHPSADRDDLEVMLLALGRLWTLGVEVDWDGFYAHETRRRVPLPTYPFEHQSYWVEPAVQTTERRHTGRVANPSNWFYVPSWRRAPLPVRVGAEGGSWLLFADGSGLARAVAARLVRTGASVRIVRPGAGFGYGPDGVFEVDPTSPDDHRRLFDALEADGLPEHIVHLYGVDPVDRTSVVELERAHEHGFLSLLALGQALGDRELPHEVEVYVVTAGMQDVTGGELECPERATVLGTCKAIAAEVTGVSCRSIDVRLGADEIDSVADRIAREVRSGSSERAVAWRGSQRWLADYRRTPLEDPDAGSIRLREGGAYLVTGGLGGIGLALAEELARSVRARLVLTGRSGLPDRGTWDARLSQLGEDDPTSRRIRAVKGLEALGAEVLVCAADASDEDAMRAAVDAANARFGGLNGVVHSAGLPGAGLLSLKTREEAERVLGPKVRGTQVLERLLGDVDLDFVLLCSSLATAVTSVGQVDYFAANAYLDAWAHHRRNERTGRRTRVVSVNWDAWSESGMAVDTAVPAPLQAGREEALRMGLSNAEGRDAFLRILASDQPQVLVSTRDLDTRIVEHEEELAIADENVAAPAAESAGTHARPSLSTDYVEPTTATQGAVAAIWADLLGIDKVGIEDEFFELGGNSLLMMQLSVRLRAEFAVVLPIKSLFDTTNVAALADRIDSVLVVTESGDEAGPDGETEEFSL
jgi:acyl transferase domain-containing protein/acyl carrier protein